MKLKIDKTLNWGETDLTVRAYDKLFLKEYKYIQNREGRLIHQKLCKWRGFDHVNRGDSHETKYVKEKKRRSKLKELDRDPLKSENGQEIR